MPKNATFSAFQLFHPVNTPSSFDQSVSRPWNICRRCEIITKSSPETKRKRVLRACTANDAPATAVLSHFEAKDLLNLRPEAPKESNVVSVVRGDFSIDIGHACRKFMYVLCEGISIPASVDTNFDEDESSLSSVPDDSPHVMVTWDELKKMCKKGRPGAFELLYHGHWTFQRVTSLSQETGRTLSLLPVERESPPTLVLGGFTMHRIVGTNPKADTMAKVGSIPLQRLHGRVLDICTGLGYSALKMADTTSVDRVVTIELDPAVHDMIRRNPWSRRLFSHDKVNMMLGPAEQLIQQFADGTFNVVFHDPPVMPLAGHLYGIDFYRELYRVCCNGASLFHYIGDPNSKQSGKLFSGVKDRLAQAGFTSIVTKPGAFGILAYRGER